MPKLTREQEMEIERIAQHKVRNYLNEIWFSAQNIELSQAKLKQSQDFLAKEMWELKDMMKTFIRESKNNYAPISISKEVDQHSIDIRDLYKNINGIHLKIAMASWAWGAIIYFIWNLN